MNPADASVLIFSTNVGVGRTLRMALRGMGARTIHLAADETQMFEGFAAMDTNAVLVYVDGPENDPGVDIIRFLRTSDRSPNVRIPIVAASPRRDLATVNAVINAGGSEYVLFPASGDALLKKITAARTSTRPFIEQPNYVGPCRRRRDDKSYPGPERRVSAAAASTKTDPEPAAS
jgi:two-component system, chemotaxis family, chemotaxis protein CheY